MDRADVAALRAWQAEGARKAETAGFDILYVYAGMGYLAYEFLLPDYNRRTDEYGGAVENRVRLVRELIDVTREATGGRCAVAPLAARAFHRSLARSASKSWYAIFALAIAAFPFNASRVFALSGDDLISASRRLSISVSTRLTKKLATE